MEELPSSVLFSSDKPLAYNRDLRHTSPNFAWSLPLGQGSFGGLFYVNLSNNVPNISVYFVVSAIWDHAVQSSLDPVECEVVGWRQLQRIYLFRICKETVK